MEFDEYGMELAAQEGKICYISVYVPLFMPGSLLVGHWRLRSLFTLCTANVFDQKERIATYVNIKFIVTFV